MKPNPDDVSLRLPRDDDQRFCFEAKCVALRVYIEPIWGWDEDFQEEFHNADWRHQRPLIVVHDGRDIGTMEISRMPQHFHLGEFYLLPEFQRCGIGARLLTEWLIETDRATLPVRLEVININPARKLYDRFGFRPIGESATHHYMERKARPSAERRESALFAPYREWGLHP